MPVQRPPRRDELKSLPLLSLVAFAGRCARRVYPLAQAAEFPEDLLLGMDVSLKKIEHKAIIWADKATAHSFLLDVGALVARVREFAADPAARVTDLTAAAAQKAVAYAVASAAAEAVFSAAETAIEVVCFGDSWGPDPAWAAASAAAKALEAAELISHAAGMTLIRAERRDLELLRETAVRDRWNDRSPVRPEFFGPLWPDGEPEGWPHGTIVHALPQPESLPSLGVPLEEIMDKLDEKYQEHREWTRQQLQVVLNKMSGKSYPTLADKQAVVARIREHLRSMDLRILCPVCKCPANLKAVAAGNAKQGVFQFAHSQAGTSSTHGGSSEFPNNLQVVDAPADSRLPNAGTRKSRG